MSLKLSDQEQCQWRDDGYFVREQVFTLAEVEGFRSAAESACASICRLAIDGRAYTLDGNRFVDINHLTLQYEHQQQAQIPVKREQVRVIEPVHELDARFASLVADLRLVEPMRPLVGASKVGLWTAKLNMKYPQAGSGFRWHQDSPYWIHDSDDVDHLPNVFVAFDDATPDNGCLRLVRGSHTRGCLRGLADGSQLEGFFTHPDEVDETQIVAPQLKAGSALFFSPHIVHGSLPNRSLTPRRAIIVTYQRAGLPELKSARPSAVLG